MPNRHTTGRAPGFLYYAPRMAAVATVVAARSTRRAITQAAAHRFGRVANIFRQRRSPSVMVENEYYGSRPSSRIAASPSVTNDGSSPSLSRGSSPSENHPYEYPNAVDVHCPSMPSSRVGSPTQERADSGLGPSHGPTPVNGDNGPSPSLPVDCDSSSKEKLGISYQQLQELLRSLRRFRSDVLGGDLLLLDYEERILVLADVQRLARDRGWQSHASMLNWDDLVGLVLRNGDWDSFFYAFNQFALLVKGVRRDVERFFRRLPADLLITSSGLQLMLSNAIGARSFEILVQFDQLVDNARVVSDAVDPELISDNGKKDVKKVRRHLKFLSKHELVSVWLRKLLDKRSFHDYAQIPFHGDVNIPVTETENEDASELAAPAPNRDRDLPIMPGYQRLDHPRPGENGNVGANDAAASDLQRPASALPSLSSGAEQVRRPALDFYGSLGWTFDIPDEDENEDDRSDDAPAAHPQQRHVLFSVDSRDHDELAQYRSASAPAPWREQEVEVDDQLTQHLAEILRELGQLQSDNCALLTDLGSVRASTPRLADPSTLPEMTAALPENDGMTTPTNQIIRPTPQSSPKSSPGRPSRGGSAEDSEGSGEECDASPDSLVSMTPR